MRCILFFLLLLSCPALAQLRADFSVSNTQGCTPLNVQFQDNSTGSPLEWFWDFGDGQTSALQNPSITYAVSGNYTVRLIVKNIAEQDYEEKTNYIKVSASPATGFITNIDSGCAPLQVSFTDTTKAQGTSITSWLWDFGDSITSSQQNPVHIFSNGRFAISLTTKTADGCTSTRILPYEIKAGKKPTAAFSASPLTGCASTERNFQNKTKDSITSSLWFFGDGAKSNLKNPVYHYQDTGWFTVRLIASQRGCADTSEMNNYVHVDGPVAKLRTIFDCNDRFTIAVRDYSIGGTSRLWDFGDNTTGTSAYAVHTYSAKGTYTIRLVVTGVSCNDTSYATVYIETASPEVAVSPIKSFYCKGDTLQFSVNNYDSAATRSFAWNFSDGNTTLFRSGYTTINHIYTQDGAYTPEIYLYNYSGCRDTIPIAAPVAIQGPVAQFQVATTSCTDASITFTDQSVGNPAGSISQWLWSYGDGTTANTSVPLQYSYPFPGIYITGLTVTDINGCVDTITHTINISQTPIVDAGNDTFVCARSKIILQPSGANTYTWQPNSDLSCTNCTNPVAVPLQSTTYYVTGTSNGCSASDSINVLVQKKQQVAVNPSEATICQGESLTLNASGTYSYAWNPANTLNNNTVPNPVASPLTTTIYSVVGRDSSNCFSDTAYTTVTVNAKPIVNITDSIVQVLIGSTHTINATKSNDVQTLKWTPSSGLSCYSCLQPVATITDNITYTLEGTNTFGCSDSDVISIVSVCTGESIFIPNTFSPNNDGMNDYFYPRAAGNVTIKSLIIFNRWGQLVFKKQNLSPNNYKDGWDGKFNNVYQNSDVYVYVMELKCSGDKVFIKKGNVTLLR